MKNKDRKIRLCIALFTASQWHGDSDEGGRALLSLSTTRKVHTEDHRQTLKNEIRNSIRYVAHMGDEYDTHENNEAKEIQRLADLLDLVKTATIGEEWLTDQENLRINEQLFRANKL